MLVAVEVRPGAGDDELRGAAGRWRDVLTGAQRELAERTPLAELFGEPGLALLERA